MRNPTAGDQSPHRAICPIAFSKATIYIGVTFNADAPNIGTVLLNFMSKILIVKKTASVHSVPALPVIAKPLKNIGHMQAQLFFVTCLDKIVVRIQKIGVH